MHGNSWIGPAAVLCQRGQSVWLHTNGDIKNVAACKVKPYELVYRDAIPGNNYDISKKVMLEDALENVEDLMDEEDEQNESQLDNQQPQRGCEKSTGRFHTSYETFQQSWTW